MIGKLFGVGTGPGDPELVTRKAARVIGQADVVAYFAKQGNASNARAIVAGLMTSQVEELHFLDLAGRLAMRLTRLAQESQPDASGKISLSWPYTQSDLAAMIGGTRQSVNRLLAQLVDEGLIEIQPDAIVISDVEELARRAER